MGAAQSSASGHEGEEGIVTVAAPEDPKWDAPDPLLQQLQALEHSLPILESSLAEGWRDLQKLYAARGCTLDARALHELVKEYQAYCKGNAKDVAVAQARIQAQIGVTEKEAEAVMQLVSRSVSQAHVAAANLQSVEVVAGQVAALGQRMSALQASLAELSRQAERLSLSRAAAPS